MTTQPKPNLIITRHPALVAYLRGQKIVNEGAEVIDHATPEIVRGRHTVGVLPLWLACEAASHTEVQVRIPPELRGVELTLEQLREFAGEIRRYVVRRIDETPAPGRPWPPPEDAENPDVWEIATLVIEYHGLGAQHLDRRGVVEALDVIATRIEGVGPPMPEAPPQTRMEVHALARLALILGVDYAGRPEWAVLREVAGRLSPRRHNGRASLDDVPEADIVSAVRAVSLGYGHPEPARFSEVVSTFTAITQQIPEDADPLPAFARADQWPGHDVIALARLCGVAHEGRIPRVVLEACAIEIARTEEVRREAYDRWCETGGE